MTAVPPFLPALLLAAGAGLVIYEATRPDPPAPGPTPWFEIPTCNNASASTAGGRAVASLADTSIDGDDICANADSGVAAPPLRMALALADGFQPGLTYSISLLVRSGAYLVSGIAVEDGRGGVLSPAANLEIGPDMNFPWRTKAAASLSPPPPAAAAAEAGGDSFAADGRRLAAEEREAGAWGGGGDEISLDDWQDEWAEAEDVEAEEVEEAVEEEEEEAGRRSLSADRRRGGGFSRGGSSWGSSRSRSSWSSSSSSSSRSRSSWSSPSSSSSRSRTSSSSSSSSWWGGSSSSSRSRSTPTSSSSSSWSSSSRSRATSSSSYYSSSSSASRYSGSSYAARPQSYAGRYSGYSSSYSGVAYGRTPVYSYGVASPYYYSPTHFYYYGGMPFYVGGPVYHYNAFSHAMMMGMTLSLISHSHHHHYSHNYAYGGVSGPSHGPNAAAVPRSETVKVDAAQDRYDLTLTFQAPAAPKGGRRALQQASSAWPLRLVVYNATLFAADAKTASFDSAPSIYVSFAPAAAEAGGGKTSWISSLGWALVGLALLACCFVCGGGDGGGDEFEARGGGGYGGVRSDAFSGGGTAMTYQPRFGGGGGGMPTTTAYY